MCKEFRCFSWGGVPLIQKSIQCPSRTAKFPLFSNTRPPRWTTDNTSQHSTISPCILHIAPLLMAGATIAYRSLQCGHINNRTGSAVQPNRAGHPPNTVIVWFSFILHSNQSVCGGGKSRAHFPLSEKMSNLMNDTGWRGGRARNIIFVDVGRQVSRGSEKQSGS